MKMTITEITGWREDTAAEMGDASHEGDGNVMRLKLEEYERKVEGNEWPGLPFTCEAGSEDEAIEKYNDKFCEYDYYKAESAEFEDVHEFYLFTLKQLMGTASGDVLFRIVDVYDDEIAVVLNDDFLEDDEGVLKMLDPLLDRKVREIRVGTSEDPLFPKNVRPTIWAHLVREDTNKEFEG